MDQIDFSSFLRIDIRTGTVVKVENFERAKNKSYKVSVDFGNEIGIKTSSAQITFHYSPNDLIGQQVCGLVNVPGRNIAGFISEFLLLGFSDAEGNVVIMKPDKRVPNGSRLH